MGGSENAKQVHEKTARETFACRFLGDFFADFQEISSQSSPAQQQ